MVLTGLSWVLPVCADDGDDLARLQQEVKELRDALARQGAEFAAELAALQAQMSTLSTGAAAVAASAADAGAAGRLAGGAVPQDSATVLARRRQAMFDGSDGDGVLAGPVASFMASAPSALQSMNPDVSVIVDTFYQHDNSPEGMSHLFEEMAGFGHSHGGGGEHGHGHGDVEEGFNLRHLELHLSADVDPYFRGWAIVAVSEDGAEIEEAVIQTLSLPFGLQLQAGKFFSNFSRINAQHSHEWDFVDRPLVHQLVLGHHGLNEKGVQLSWLAPTPFHLLFGLEAFQGENELMFSSVDAEELPEESGPRLWVGWVKLAPELPGPHGAQFGLYAGRGVHQEAHDGNGDGVNDHWLDGHGAFCGGDFVYKYDSPRPYGQGDLVVQGEYMYRWKELEVAQHDLMPAFTGRDRSDRQDGFYLQATYGLWPRWRGGLRFEQVGLVNVSEYPNGSAESFGSSRRVAGMLDFSPSEFSRLRLQVNRGSYELTDGREDVWQFYLQWMISLGSHGAHNF